ncbi:MAG: glycosyltransferase family 2 protein [Paludibacteraceae bacterium]|nr:glycosyltransferase family 2 protein [Paludibacteraceae bacterium]
MPLISVIIPVYKAEKFIRRLIESILSQSMIDIEIILVDDGCNDNAMAIVKAMASEDNRIHYIDNQSNVGPMAARYKGLLISSGKYVVFIDSDDTLPDNALSLLYTHAEKNNSDLVIGSTCSLDQNQNLISTNKPVLNYGNNDSGFIESLLTLDVSHNLHGKLIRNSVVRNTPFEIIEGCKNFEDAAFLFQIAKRIRSVSVIDAEVYNYIDCPDSSSHNEYTVDGATSTCLMVPIIKNILSEYSLPSSLVNAYFTRFFYNFRFYDECIPVIARHNMTEYISYKYIFLYLRFPNNIQVIRRLFTKKLLTGH